MSLLTTLRTMVYCNTSLSGGGFMNGHFSSMGTISVGNKQCCLEVKSPVGGGFYNSIHTK